MIIAVIILMFILALNTVLMLYESPVWPPSGLTSWGGYSLRFCEIACYIQLILNSVTSVSAGRPLIFIETPSDFCWHYLLASEEGFCRPKWRSRGWKCKNGEKVNQTYESFFVSSKIRELTTKLMETRLKLILTTVVTSGRTDVE